MLPLLIISLHLAIPVFPLPGSFSSPVSITSFHICSVQEFLPAVHRLRLLGLVLGPDLPWADEPSPRTLRFSTARILTLLSLLIPAFSLLLRPQVLPVLLRPDAECSSTTAIRLTKFTLLYYMDGSHTLICITYPFLNLLDFLRKSRVVLISEFN